MFYRGFQAAPTGPPNEGRSRHERARSGTTRFGGETVIPECDTPDDHPEVHRPEHLGRPKLHYGRRGRGVGQ